jgi:3-phenylpropionate/trans-cinnamate dioxygenase ferredoxin reductase component
MRIVLVGAGLAAQRCAETLRGSGHDGPITMVGAEPHPPYDRPPLSKALLAGERPNLTLRPTTWHADHDVELRTGTRATDLDDRGVRLDTGETLAYDRVLIATGARPVELPGLAHAHTLRTLDDALRLDQSLKTASHIAIVGAGLIGQEVASAARARGIAATLIDAARNPFDALMGPAGGRHLQRLHKEAGVTLRLGRRLIATHGEHALALDDGTIVEADVFLTAVGVRPDTAWTGGYAAPNVHAAGDATGQAHWEAAARQGAAAARAMLGLPARPERPPLVWSDQHGVRIQRVGDSQGVRPPESTPLKGSDPSVLTYSRNGRIAAVVLMNRPGALRQARRSIDTPIREAA